MKKELYEKLSPEAQGQLNDTLHETFCESTLTLLEDSLENSDLTKEEVQSARDFAETKPDSDAAKELLGFLDSDIAKEALAQQD